MVILPLPNTAAQGGTSLRQSARRSVVPPEGCKTNAKPETKCGPGNLLACARDFSVCFTLVIRVRARHASHRYLGERRDCDGDFASRAHCVPGLGRVGRLYRRPVDCRFTVGAGLPAQGGNVHKFGRRPFNCVPGAARALADPLRFVSRESVD